MKKAKCKGLNCDVEAHVGELRKIKDPAKGYFYLCESCYNRQFSYGTTNREKSHNDNKRSIQYGFEWEMDSRPAGVNVLIAHKWMPSRDDSVFIEWKSPLYKNTHGLMKFFRTADNIGLQVGDACGSHLNVSLRQWTRAEITAITRFYKTLFYPLAYYLKTHQSSTIRVFGRYFCYYACYPFIDRGNTIDCNCSDKKLFINVLHDEWLEIRLCKWTSAEQYFELVRFAGFMAEIIQKNYLNHYIGTSEKIKHKAEITGVKILSKYLKMFNLPE